MSAKGNSISANRKNAQKAAAKKRPQTWRPGQSGNPAGGPKRGESWTEIIKRVGEYTPSEAAERSLELARQLLKVGDGVTLKEAVVLRVYGALMFDPQSGLLNSFMDRSEGRVSDELKLSGNSSAPLIFQVTYGTRRIAPGAAPETSRDAGQPEAPQDVISRPAGGEDNGPGDAGGSESIGGPASA